MADGIKAVIQNKAWELAELPLGRKTIPLKEIFKVKRYAKGVFEKYKDSISTKRSHLLSESNQLESFSLWQQLTTFIFCTSTARTPFYTTKATSSYM
jgi:hypothetical protein